MAAAEEEDSCKEIKVGDMTTSTVRRPLLYCTFSSTSGANGPQQQQQPPPPGTAVLSPVDSDKLVKVTLPDNQVLPAQQQRQHPTQL